MKMLVKDILRFIAYFFSDQLIKKRKIENKKIAILKLDAIGDYILFRNFIEAIKKSEKYKEYSITLIGNEVYKDLAIELDSNFVDHFIFVNFKSMTRNLIYRTRMYREICSHGYEIVLNPTYSREYNVTDSLVKVISAKEKIGSEGILGNIPRWQKKISDKFYTKLIPVKKEIEFEFYKNKKLIEVFIGNKVEIKETSCSVQKQDFLDLDKYIVFFPGASTNVRRWPVEYFIKIAKFVVTNTKCGIVIVGSSQDCKIANQIISSVESDKVRDLTGKTTLLQTIQVIKGASLIITNETSGHHMAVMTKTPVIVLYNGNNFKRFIPYPSEMVENYFPVYHPLIEKNMDEYEKISNEYGYLSKLKMDEISVDRVLSIIQQQNIFTNLK